jgi:fluoroquinolone resistance protein
MTDATSLLAGSFHRDTVFRDLDLPAADLGSKEFFRCTFLGCRFPESRWERANLERCVFEDCDLSGFVPTHLVAADVRFVRSKLQGVSFFDLGAGSRVAFEGCNLRYASFEGASLRKTPFLDCRLGEAAFTGCDLAGADFAGSELAGAGFERCNLEGADLSRALGAFVDPAKNRVKGLRVPVETAVALARWFGMQVAGTDG